MYLMGSKYEFWFPCLVIILTQRCFLKAICHKIRVTVPGHFYAILSGHYVTVTFSGRLFRSGRSFKSNCSNSHLGGNFFVVAFFGHFFGRFYGRVSRVKKLAIYSTWYIWYWPFFLRLFNSSTFIFSSSQSHGLSRNSNDSLNMQSSVPTLQQWSSECG